MAIPLLLLKETQAIFMNVSSQINSNPWLNFSMIGMMWLLNSLCLVYCVATTVVIAKMVLS